MNMTPEQIRRQANRATLREAAEILGVGRGALAHAIRRAGIEPIGRVWARDRWVRLYDLEDLEAALLARVVMEALETDDPAELARQRGITAKPAERLLRRRGRKT